MSTPQPATEGATNPTQNLSVEELIAQRMTAYSNAEPEAEPEQPEEQPEAEELPEQAEAEEQAAESFEEPEEEEQEPIDLLSLTAEQIQDLAKRGRSRLLSDLGKLRAEKRHLEQQLAAQAEAKPLPKPLANNPFSALTSVAEIEAKRDELEKVAEETDRILEDHEDYGADDIITLGDNEFTKRQIRQANRNARDAMLKFLPAQHAEIVRAEQRKQAQQQFEERIPQDVPEAAEAESTVGKLYQSMVADPIVDQVRQQVPDIAPQLSYLLAHAARSIAQTQASPRTRQAAPGQAPKAKVPDAPAGAAAARSGAKPAAKRSEQAIQHFEKTGRPEDLIAARIARFTNR